jgi:hypothetical protein
VSVWEGTFGDDDQPWNVETICGGPFITLATKRVPYGQKHEDDPGALAIQFRKSSSFNMFLSFKFVQ